MIIKIICLVVIVITFKLATAQIFETDSNYDPSKSIRGFGDTIRPARPSEEAKGANRVSGSLDQHITTPKTFKQYDIPITQEDILARRSHAAKIQNYNSPPDVDYVSRQPKREDINQQDYMTSENVADANYFTGPLTHDQNATDSAKMPFVKSTISASYKTNDEEEKKRNFVENQMSLLLDGRSRAGYDTKYSTKQATTKIPNAGTTYSANSYTSKPGQYEGMNPLQFLWNLLRAMAFPPETTPVPPNKPPKKYKTATTTTPSSNYHYNLVKEDKRILKKLKPSTVEAPNYNSIAAPSQKAEGPFRIAVPTQLNKSYDKDKRGTSDKLRQLYICPRENEVRFQLFPKICQTDNDCAVWEREELCCDIFGSKSCVSGVPKPLEEAKHAPIFGLIPRKCPTRPLAELWWDVQECHTDMDCWPRVCCPDGRRRYCRTSQPELETIPEPVKRSLDYLTEYLECTPPPPRIFDLHPKACTSSLDCFPNVCCQEAGLRHCRPPKKSVLTFMANFLNVDFVRRFTQNIIIK